MTLSETWIDFLAGWASGAVAVLVVQPVDTVLTRAQAQPTVMAAAAAGTGITTTTSLVQQFGVKALWRGSPVMISAVPFQNALLMGGYGVGKEWNLAVAGQEASLLNIGIAGTVGGIAQSFLMSPVEYYKVQQQVHFKTAATTTPKFLTSRGLTATLWRDGIPHGVWFASYEYAKTELAQTASLSGTSDSMIQSVGVPMTAGAIAATVAWAVGYPFDILKTRIQATEASKGMYEMATEIVATDGLMGLYRGFGLKLLRAVPASMVGFLTYETVADWIRSS